MLNLFKKTKPSFYIPEINQEVTRKEERIQESIAEKKQVEAIMQLEVYTPPKKKSMSKNDKLVAEIHGSFFNEVDQLLQLANKPVEVVTDKQELIKKVARLKSLGFTRTKEIIEGEAEIMRLDVLKSENVGKEQLKKAILYFSQKYPNYKFITPESVEKICNKYGLFQGDVSMFIGEVPDTNLKHIENFRIAKEDKAYEKFTRYDHSLNSSGFVGDFEYTKIKSECDHVGLLDGGIKKYLLRRSAMYHSIFDNNNNFYIKENCFHIVAPIKDFDLSNVKVNGSKIQSIVKDDPIVLCPVFYEKKQYFLVVTAWGLEAADELVVNENHN